ncbi:hypothetical protein ABRQ01_19955 [Pectobacterium aroidearum]|uniref:hypothetical protein n=1 Tax=Pectobacterium aroidearum TaxID=1201031 RepID=UPI0032F71D57
MILPAFYFISDPVSRYRLACVSIIILPRATVTVTGIPVIKPDSSGQRPLRLMAEGGLDLPFYSSYFDIRLAGVTAASDTGKTG